MYGGEKADTADFWIERLGLAPHAEGGYFVSAYRSHRRISTGCYPGFPEGDRIHVSSIYYLLKKGQFSAFHRLRATEVWNFYSGGALSLYILGPDGLVEKRLGRNADKGETFQTAVEPGLWFGAAPQEGVDYSLVGCTVVPGFEYDDMEFADRSGLLAAFPGEREIIERLT